VPVLIAARCLATELSWTCSMYPQQGGGPPVYGMYSYDPRVTESMQQGRGQQEREPAPIKFTEASVAVAVGLTVQHTGQCLGWQFKQRNASIVCQIAYLCTAAC
jgi:hypothetical protein